MSHMQHNSAIIAAKDTHSEATKIALLRRLMKGVECEDPNLIFILRTFDFNIRHETITQITFDSCIEKLETMAKPETKGFSFPARGKHDNKGQESRKYF